MHTLAVVFTSIVIVAHVYFLILEMFLWTKPLGLKIFRQKKELAQASRVLAANQGLYNGFLAVGLAWGLFSRQPGLVNYLLLCVVVAGVYGAVTVSRRIFWVQSVPAILALGCFFMASEPALPK